MDPACQGCDGQIITAPGSALTDSCVFCGALLRLGDAARGASRQVAVAPAPQAVCCGQCVEFCLYVAL